MTRGNALCMYVVVMNRLPLEKYEVLWMANDTIFKQKKEITSQLWSMVGERLGKGQAYGAARSAILQNWQLKSSLQLHLLYDVLGLGLAKEGEVFSGFEIHTSVTQRVLLLRFRYL